MGGHSAGGGDNGGGSMQIEEVQVDLTPFGILYDLAAGLGTPSAEEYAMVIEVTMGFLNTYTSLQYDGQGLEEFETTATATIYRDGVPQIDFVAAATFRGIEVQAPSVDDMDGTVERAFSGANLALYLSMLQNLPQDNKFSTTTGARLTTPVNLEGQSRTTFLGTVSTAVGTAGIAGAVGAGALIIFAIGFMIYGKRQSPLSRGSAERAPLRKIFSSKEEQREAEAHAQAQSPAPDQETVAGETTTCSSSVGASSRASCEIEDPVPRISTTSRKLKIKPAKRGSRKKGEKREPDVG